MTEHPATPSDDTNEPNYPATVGTVVLANEAPSRRTVIQTVVLMMILVTLCGGLSIYIVSDRSVRAAYSLAATASDLKNTYPDQLNWDDMFRRGVDGMTSILDRYSYYMTKSDFGRLDEDFHGEYVGIGVSVIRDPMGLLVMSVRENGPAATAGILNGDIILAIGDTSLSRFEADRSIKLLRGRDGTEVSIRLFRPVTHDTLSVKVTRKKLDIVHVPFAGLTPDSAVYIRLLDFEGGASEDVKAAIDSLITDQSPSPRGIILDLRGNPGGLFNEARRTAELSLEKGKLIVGTESRSRWTTEEFRAGGHDLTRGLPMIVLVDRGSASAAEIVAGALQKNHRAILVGDTTFGKGLVQGFARFEDGDGLRLTISRYYLEGKTYLNHVDSIVYDSGTGLAPDSVFPFVERQPFLLALERSLLLEKFAAKYEREILAEDTLLRVNPNWAARFEKFVGENGFGYRSDLLSAAQLVVDMSRLDGVGTAAEILADSMLFAAQRIDLGLFERHRDYIEFRLRQLAVERTQGVYQSYAKVVVRFRPDIRYAGSLLRSLK